MNLKQRLYPVLPFLAAYLCCLVLYWEGLDGLPIWDDLPHWFGAPMLTEDSFSQRDIWSRQAWPLSLSLQRFIYGQWKGEFLYYHILSLFIHFLNAALVFLLGRRLGLRNPMMLFFLFLIHPANVLAVNWMIQIKTLLCFLFAFASLLLFLSPPLRPLKVGSSAICFLASVLAKASSLMFPAFFFLTLWKGKASRFALVLPFVLISGYGLFRMKTDYTDKGMERARQTLAQAEHGTGAGRVLQSSHYYFWQSLIPLNTVPVRGLNSSPVGILEFLSVIFWCWLLFRWRAERMIICLGCGFLILLPYLGLVPAPYMSVTWVSDQHLYLALPALLLFWLLLSEKLGPRWGALLPLLLVPMFLVKTYQTVQYFKNEEVFFIASLEHNPANVPVAFNLANYFHYEGNDPKAYEVLQRLFQETIAKPELRESVFFPHALELYEKLERRRLGY